MISTSTIHYTYYIISINIIYIALNYKFKIDTFLRKININNK